MEYTHSSLTKKGDFNQSNLDWNTNGAIPADRGSNEIVDIVDQSTLLTQINQMRNDNARILDLLLVNENLKNRANASVYTGLITFASFIYVLRCVTNYKF